MKRFLIAALGLACTPAQRPIVEVAPASSNVAPVASAATSLPQSIDPSPKSCASELVVGDVTPETPTCTIYGLQPGVRGILQAQCNGHGQATARFGMETPFEGTVVDGKFDLSRQFVKPVGDGCEWRFTETLVSLGPGFLAFEYSEEITQNNGQCYRPCGAVGTVKISR